MRDDSTRRTARRAGAFLFSLALFTAAVIVAQVLLLAVQIKRERQVRLIRVWAVKLMNLAWGNSWICRSRIPNRLASTTTLRPSGVSSASEES